MIWRMNKNILFMYNTFNIWYYIIFKLYYTSRLYRRPICSYQWQQMSSDINEIKVMNNQQSIKLVSKHYIIGSTNLTLGDLHNLIKPLLKNIYIVLLYERHMDVH